MHDDSELTRAAREARSPRELAGVSRRIATALGFQHFLFGARVPLSLTHPLQIVFSGYPGTWRTRYDDCGYMQVDPVLQRGLNSNLAFAWDEIQEVSIRGSRVLHEASEHGLRYGVTAPLHGSGGEVALLSLAREQALPSDTEERLRLLQRVQWYCSLVHERLRALALDRSGTPRPRLSERQRACLGLAAEGLPAHAIARNLRISERTVVYHLGCASAKLGVRTRMQAIARAVALGELGPANGLTRIAHSQQLLELPPPPNNPRHI